MYSNASKKVDIETLYLKECKGIHYGSNANGIIVSAYTVVEYS